ncbi:NHL repeat-containing protein 2 isoform X2 [Neodiprion fabricii]|uniref:NHL repeat-containing protein 2 isoform X2 n=1 Tax=Neodiprion fabricii TaxID=2872261 RepID=UPI001ED91024|nr:NHL repeat-containing protein 2 isoform X2 [Neodiprion fabricii]
MMSYGCLRLLKRTPFLSRSFWTGDSGAEKMNVREVIEDLTQVSIEVRQEVTSVTNPREKEKIALRHIKKYAAKDACANEFQKGLEWFNVSRSISMRQDLTGKICVLDFFTYCCINCMHILPDLAALEKKFSIEDGLVVIGVHSAKFANEKDSSKILAAVQRYNIAHPVVNDAKLSMWQDIGIVCWPSLVILGPKGQPLFALVGEGHREEMFLYIKVALAYFKSLNEISDHSLPLKPSQHLLPVSKDTLLFPGKIHLANIKNKDRMVIADTGNNRILIMDLKGKVEHVVGGYAPAFRDGNFQTARFNAPQGICSLGDEIFVADTENHAIRKIDLVLQTVTTLVGTGEQSHDYVGGNVGKAQSLSSPWDVAIHHHKQEEKSVPVLMIAIAGTHQIWGFFLEDTIWWKKKSITAGTCIAIVGSGREENRNNSYPHAAGLAQPSGLALAREKNMLFFADSESSSVRVVHLDDGKVSGVCGGDRNPGNLHDFGDIDGRQCSAKLQHPLGLAWDSVDSVVYIADTYNHKIKKVDLLGNCRTLYGAGKPTANHKFDEPSGLAVHLGSRIIYVADTNNHRIVSISLEDNKIDTISVDLPSETTHSDGTYKFDAEVSSDGGNLEIALDVKFMNDLKLNSDAPQRWSVNLPDKWTTQASKGDLKTPITLNIPKGELTVEFIISLDIITCKTDECIPKKLDLVFTIRRNSKAQSKVKLNEILEIE